MNIINLNLGDRSYPIHIASGLLDQISSILSEKNRGQKWIIISQYRLMELFGFDLMGRLKSSGFTTDFITVPIGEAAKSINEFSRIISQMIEMNCDRSTSILALGGGVVGDVAGFAASTFMRGVDYYQIPTTLLAMVDSAIGGKTGINIAEGKNLVGAIYQPKAVFVDPTLLKSLPKEEVISGLGEIIKYGAIKDKEFFNEISNGLENIESFPFENIIYRACEIKADIVTQDEREGSIRRILNFGHTIGHALEAHFGYGKLRHGEAVSYGMICAGWISNQLGHLSNNDYQRLKKTIEKLPLPMLNNFDQNKILPFVKNDKKTVSGKLNFVILDTLGSATTTKDVSDELILNSLKVIQ
jgi:3-dehydroquinate synthase